VNGCNGSNQISITVSSCAGLADYSNDISFSVYPNPAKDILMLVINTSKSFEGKIEMLDATGRLLVKQTLKLESGNNEQTVHLEEFARGIYFLRIISEEGHVRGIKVVKE
jgi:hypothetical protein